MGELYDDHQQLTVFIFWLEESGQRGGEGTPHRIFLIVAPAVEGSVPVRHVAAVAVRIGHIRALVICKKEGVSNLTTPSHELTNWTLG